MAYRRRRKPGIYPTTRHRRKRSWNICHGHSCRSCNSRPVETRKWFPFWWTDHCGYFRGTLPTCSEPVQVQSEHECCVHVILSTCLLREPAIGRMRVIIVPKGGYFACSNDESASRIFLRCPHIGWATDTTSSFVVAICYWKVNKIYRF